MVQNLFGTFNKDCIVYADTVEEEALKTIRDLLDCQAFENIPIRIMPDTHQGKGIVIGFTAPIGKMICPSHVGVDIGCMIDTYITDTKINAEEYALIEHRIRKEIPFGIEINKTTQIDYKDFYKFMNNGLSRIRSLWPEMVDSFATCDEEGISDLCHRIGMDEGKFYKSLGSVGGGNHFIEIGVTPEGNYAFTIHCGSRNLGVKICNYWENIAKNSNYDKALYRELVQKAKKETKDKKTLSTIIQKIKDDLIAKSAPNGYLTGDNMVGYITDMAIAQLYAEYNHFVIANKIKSIFKHINNAKVVEHIVSVHNYIDYRDHIIRKGAIRSYEGEKMVIPFNMRDGLAICIGKSNKDWNYSAPHGCGRLMSRTKAKETLSVSEYAKQMEGIYSTSVGKATIDEAPNAYKPMDEILSLIEPTCQVLYLIRPVINLKSTNGE